MKSLLAGLIRQPITVAVGTMLSVFAGILAITQVPVRMTPEVSSIVIAVTTNWENASAEEIESDIVEEQEKVLGEVTGLASMTSTSAAGQGTIRLEFETGTNIEAALAQVLQKLDQVPGYPDGVLQPVVEDIDPESVDYIARHLVGDGYVRRQAELVIGMDDMDDVSATNLAALEATAKDYLLRPETRNKLRDLAARL